MFTCPPPARRSARFVFALSLVAVAQLGSADARAEAGSDGGVTNERRAQAIVKGAGFAISVGDIEDYIVQQPPAVRERFREPAERKALVENLVKLELMSAEAARRGFDKNLAVRQTVKDGAIQALIRSEIDEKITPQAVSQEDIAKFYAEHPQDFHRPAERRASYIKLATRDEAEKLLKEVTSADLKRFGELAKEHSQDAETKLRGGDLGYFVKDLGDAGGALGTIDTGIRDAVFAQKTIGDTVSAPIAVDGGFAIVRYTGERPERHADLASASGSIRNRLWREQRTKAVSTLIEGVRTREKPQVFAERVDLVKFDDMDRPPAGFAPDAPAPVGSPSAVHPVTGPKPVE